MRPLISVLSMLVLGATFAAPASAEPYAEVDFGATLPLDRDLKNALSPDAKLSYDDAFTFSVAAGYKLGNGFRVDGEYSYQSPDFDKLTGTIVGIPVQFNGLDDSHLTLHSFTANGYYDIKTGTALTPFVGGGLGFAYAVAKANSIINANDSDVMLAYQATAGASYAVTDKIDVVASYRYFGTTEGSFRTTISVGSASATGDAKASC